MTTSSFFSLLLELVPSLIRFSPNEIPSLSPCPSLPLPLPREALRFVFEDFASSDWRVDDELQCPFPLSFGTPTIDLLHFEELVDFVGAESVEVGAAVDVGITVALES